MVWWNLLFRNLPSYLHWGRLHFLGEVTGSQTEPFAQIWSHFPIPWFCGLGDHTQQSWTCFAISGMPPWPQPFVCHTYAARDWCHMASLCHHLREGLGARPFGFVFWENDLLPGTSGTAISRQQESPIGVLWSCGQKPAQVGWAVPCAALARSRAAACKDWHSNKEGPGTNPTKSLGRLVQGCPWHWGGRTGGSCWHWAIWLDSSNLKDPLWQSASGPNVSSLGPFNCKSYLWTMFPLGAEQKSFNPSCLVLFYLFLFSTGFHVLCS